MNAKLINLTACGLELRKATRKTQTWPGYACPLNHCGLWAGTSCRHTLVSEEMARHMGFRWVEEA